MNSPYPSCRPAPATAYVYVDATADYAMAEAIVINAKTQRTGVCNAAESLLVEKSWAEKHLGSRRGAQGQERWSSTATRPRPPTPRA